MIFFTADPHFGHVNSAGTGIIDYAGRTLNGEPFTCIAQHDRFLIDNWNRAVRDQKDEVYLLGDLGLTTRERLLEIRRQLNGRIYFLKGNHDSEIKGDLGRSFMWVKDYYELKIKDPEMNETQRIVLCHYPFESWNAKVHGSWHLHGHCHGMLPSADNLARLDVGVDVHDFAPVSYERVKAIMTRKIIKPDVIAAARLASHKPTKLTV
jgi:calcineurin-like phosphoesterase family protein